MRLKRLKENWATAVCLRIFYRKMCRVIECECALQFWVKLKAFCKCTLSHNNFVSEISPLSPFSQINEPWKKKTELISGYYSLCHISNIICIVCGCFVYLSHGMFQVNRTYSSIMINRSDFILDFVLVSYFCTPLGVRDDVDYTLNYWFVYLFHISL